jgi:hypothetical protein
MEIELIEIFRKANQVFLQREVANIQNGVSERNLCGRLAIYLSNIIALSNFSEYYVDPEYNRNYGGRIKTILDEEFKEIIINCDIIIHSRGENIERDNLIAFEMKKSNRPDTEKDSDRKRLRALTKDSYDDVWSADNETLPEHVCGYIWGVYLELDSEIKTEKIELYQKGNLVSDEIIHF